MSETRYRYLPLTGALPGAAFERQTEQFLNDLGGRAEEAASTAQTAQVEAGRAVDAASTALAAASEANIRSAAARDAAQAAQDAAVRAGDAATSAQDSADRAGEAAWRAQNTADAATTAAQAAQATADQGVRDADAARHAADAAQSSADRAQSTADGKASQALDDATGVLPVANGGTGRTDGKTPGLVTPRTIALSGGVTGSATFDGSADISIPVTGLDMDKADAGVLSVARGGTGAATAADARANLGLEPAGIIVLWHGDVPPSGWRVCDGDGGSPNLSDYATAPLRYIQRT